MTCRGCPACVDYPTWLEWCDHEPACDTEQECDRLSCDLCFDGAPCIEHRTQAKESAMRDAAERSRS